MGGADPDRVLELMRELGLEYVPHVPPGRARDRVEGELDRYTGTIPKLAEHVLADFGQAQ